MSQEYDLITGLSRLQQDSAFREDARQEDTVRFDPKTFGYLDGLLAEQTSPRNFRRCDSYEALQTELRRVIGVVRGLVFVNPEFATSAMRARALALLEALGKVHLPPEPNPVKGRLDLSPSVEAVFARGKTLSGVLSGLEKMLADYRGAVDFPAMGQMLVSLGDFVEKRFSRHDKTAREKIHTFLTRLHGHMNARYGRIDHATLARLFSGLGSLGDEEVPREFMVTALEKNRPDASPMAAAEIGMMVSGMKNQGPENTPPGFFTLMTERLRKARGPFNAQNCSSVFSALRRQRDHELLKPYLEAGTERLLETTDVFRPEQCAEIFWGTQNLGTKTVPLGLVPAMLPHMKRPQRPWNLNQISDCLQGVQFLTPEFIPDGYFEFLAQAFMKAPRENNLRDMTDALYGLAPYREDPRANQIKALLLHSLRMNDGRTANRLDIINLTCALKLLREPMPEWLDEKFSAFCAQRTPTPTRREIEAGEICREWFPDTEILVSHYEDGFEMDLYLPELCLNIELDGGHHDHQKLRDDRRKIYFEEAHEIFVERIDMRKGNFRLEMDCLLKKYSVLKPSRSNALRA